MQSTIGPSTVDLVQELQNQLSVRSPCVSRAGVCVLTASMALGQAARAAKVTAEEVAAARAVELDTVNKRVEELTRRCDAPLSHGPTHFAPFSSHASSTLVRSLRVWCRNGDLAVHVARAEVPDPAQTDKIKELEAAVAVRAARTHALFHGAVVIVTVLLVMHALVVLHSARMRCTMAVRYVAVHVPACDMPPVRVKSKRLWKI